MNDYIVHGSIGTQLATIVHGFDLNPKYAVSRAFELLLEEEGESGIMWLILEAIKEYYDNNNLDYIDYDKEDSFDVEIYDNE